MEELKKMKNKDIPKFFMTEDKRLGINVAGHVVVHTLEEWYMLDIRRENTDPIIKNVKNSPDHTFDKYMTDKFYNKFKELPQKGSYYDGYLFNGIEWAEYRGNKEVERTQSSPKIPYLEQIKFYQQQITSAWTKINKLINENQKNKPL